MSTSVYDLDLLAEAASFLMQVEARRSEADPDYAEHLRNMALKTVDPVRSGRLQKAASTGARSQRDALINRFDRSPSPAERKRAELAGRDSSDTEDEAPRPLRSLRARSADAPRWQQPGGLKTRTKSG